MTKKILVVDDDVDLLFSVTRILKKNGFTVIPLLDCTLAVQVALHDPPDIILLDVNLGPCDGREICREIKDILPLPVPIVLFSANGEYVASLKDYHADGFIQKPFESKEFLEFLHLHLPKEIVYCYKPK